MSWTVVLRGIVLYMLIIGVFAPLWFFWFWTWFEYWRRHRGLTNVLVLVTFLVVGIPMVAARDTVLAGRVPFPSWVALVGWLLVALGNVFAIVADRQIGVRVRYFTPFFERQGRIELKTMGAYGVVRHPLYAAAIWIMVGLFLATGYPAMLVAGAVFTLGASWFTKQEEHRLVTLLDDPSEYDRYRRRVPALFPFFHRR